MIAGDIKMISQNGESDSDYERFAFVKTRNILDKQTGLTANRNFQYLFNT